MSPDVRVTGGGSLYFAEALTEAAKSWFEENVPEGEEDRTYWHGKLVVEHRYIEPLVEGMRGDGLEVEW